MTALCLKKRCFQIKTVFVILAVFNACKFDFQVGKRHICLRIIAV